MADVRLRPEVRRLRAQGSTYAGIAAALGIPQTTAYRWATQEPVRTVEPERCPVCQDDPASTHASAPYCYLLGQYLGDGHLVTQARVPVLRIYACADYPEVTREIEDAVRAVRGRNPGLVTGPARSEHVVTVQSYWMHWPCLFPQHGPGRKHERPIVLESWQQELVEAHPWPLIRGLIHSDGCRAVNHVRVQGRSYAYPRYFFAQQVRRHPRDLHGRARPGRGAVEVEPLRQRVDRAPRVGGAARRTRRGQALTRSLTCTTWHHT